MPLSLSLLELGKRLVFMWLITTSAMVAAAESTIQYTNQYTIENTFNKLVKNYPFIEMGRLDIPEGVSGSKEITYKIVAGERLALDVYWPSQAQAEQLPAILLVHGGGWWQGYRENMTPLAIKLAERGVVAVTVSYRLAGTAKYPAAIHDVRDALDWLFDNAADYKVDRSRIALGGASAGGQIAALTALTFGDKNLDGHPAQDGRMQGVSAIVNVDGLSDFTTPLALKHENDPAKKPSSAERWFGGRYEEKTALWQQGSPINYVTEHSPPILFLNSSRERFSAGQQDYINKYVAMGGCASSYKFEDSPHSYWLFEPWLTPTANIIAAFLTGTENKLEQQLAVHCH